MNPLYLGGAALLISLVAAGCGESPDTSSGAGGDGGNPTATSGDGGSGGGGGSTPACAAGAVAAACLCGSAVISSGYCCDAAAQSTACVVPACEAGPAARECTCGAEVVSRGYCCDGTSQVGPCVVTPAFYVSPDGNDANTGLSVTEPFKTLEKARDSARASTTTKTVYLLGGTYNRSATLNLEYEDKGQSWLGYPGQLPILEGSSTTSVALQINGNDITIRFIQFQNFVTNTIWLGWGDATHAVIDSNTILNTLSTDWVQAAIYMCCGDHTGVKITHNSIRGSNYIGIHAGSSATSAGTINDTVIAFNAVHDSCRTVADCGAIYVYEVEHTSTNITVDNNVIGNYGKTDNGSRALYLDDNSSNVTLRNNVAYGTGQWVVHFHGGHNNEFSNNIFDVSGAGNTLGLYQHTGAKTPAEKMANNSFRCNIVYSSAKAKASLWEASQDLPIEPPTVSDNVYWGTQGALANTAPIIDSSPKLVDPQFVNPAAADYSFGGANPAASCGFTPIDVSKVGPLPNL